MKDPDAWKAFAQENISAHNTKSPYVSMRSYHTVSANKQTSRLDKKEV